VEVNYTDMFEYVKQEMNNNDRVEWYPFRDRFKHTLRVLKWAERLKNEEGGNWEIIKIACIFHDVGWDKNVNHSIVSESIAKKYLLKHNYDNEKLGLVLEAIKNHNLRSDENLVELESKIVMDADILDEVGAISIIWDCMASQIDGYKDYSDVYERIKLYYGKLSSNLKLLKTKTGMRLYKERLEFISQFLNELEFELL